MRIQHNVMAMNAYRNYTNNVSAMKANLEKLSSGYKINRAGDDAAGLAISEKMRAQISGLQTAQKNAKDGISLVQTAEGALTEVHDMLNRMVELATQSANGTYDNDTDRYQLQKEMDQLRSEINRIADSSNFNGINLLDGTMSTEDTAGVTQNINIAKLVGTAAAVGAGTIPHNNPGTETTGTEFEVNLHDVWMNNLKDGELSIKVGDAEIKLAGAADADDEAVVTADKIVKLLTGAATEAELGLEIKDGLTKGTGTDPNTVTIGGQKFNVIAGSDGTSVKFQQAARPTKDAENVSPQQKVTVSMTAAEGATKTPKLDKINDDIKNFGGEASVTPNTKISLTLKAGSTEQANGYVAASDSSVNISASGTENITAANGENNDALNIDAILNALNASGTTLGTEANDGNVTISYKAAGDEEDATASFELKVGDTVIGTAEVPENVAASGDAVLEFKTTGDASLGKVKLTNSDSDNPVTDLSGLSISTGLKVNTTRASAINIASGATPISGNSNLTAENATGDDALKLDAIKEAAGNATGAVTIKAPPSGNKLELYVGNTKIGEATADLSVPKKDGETNGTKDIEFQTLDGDSPVSLGKITLTNAATDEDLEAAAGFSLDTGYAIGKQTTEAIKLESKDVTMGNTVVKVLTDAGATKEGSIVIGWDGTANEGAGAYTVTVGGTAMKNVSGAVTSDEDGNTLTIKVGTGNSDVLAILDLGDVTEAEFQTALGTDGLIIGTWTPGEEKPQQTTTVSDSETLFNGDLAEGADESTALKSAGEGVKDALTTGDLTIGSGDNAIKVDLSTLEDITEESTLGAYATALEAALQEAADASEGNIKYENFQVTIGEDGIKVTYEKSVNMPEEIAGTPGTEEPKTSDFLEDMGLDTTDLTATLTSDQVTAFNSGDVKITIGDDFEIDTSTFGLTTTDTVNDALKKIQDAVNFQFDLHTAEHAEDTEPWTMYSNFEFTDDAGNGLSLQDGGVKGKWTETPMNEEEEPGGAGGAGGTTTYDWNPKTTAQKAVEAGDGFRLASTNFELTKDMVTDASITIGKETYKFTTGDKSGVDGNTITLDKNLSGDKLLDKAGELLTQAGKNNADFSIGYEGGKVQVVEKEGQTGYLKDGKSTLTSFDAISEALSYTTGSKPAGRGLTLQIGDTADSYNRLTVSITDCHTSSLGLDKISISDQESATDAIKSIKDAINRVSDIRGTLGATQNRLDHTINNLSVMTENIQDAESTIRDVDVAEEMMAYTKNNILIQSAQAMLAQANQVPQGVLQLLG